MKRGEQFKRIFALLSEGKTAQEIIEIGFPSSSVYWAQKKAGQGTKPELPRTGESVYTQYLRRKGLLHECGDGRNGILDDVEVLTDEGIILQLTCNRCYAITKTRFEEWTDDSKERYLEMKAGKAVRVAPPPILKIM